MLKTFGLQPCLILRLPARATPLVALLEGGASPSRRTPAAAPLVSTTTASAWDSLGVRGGIVRAERSRSRGRGEHLPKCQIRAKIKNRAIPAKAGSAKSVQKD